MICHKYKCIFVHIPKTAGQSIEHVFLDLVGLTWKTRAPLLLKKNEDPSLGPPRLSHLKASEYVKCGHISQQSFDEYFKFSYVRNPWSRIVSFYKFLGKVEKDDFKTYLFNHFYKQTWQENYWFVAPQYEYLYDESENLLVDFVGKFEDLQGGFNHICEKSGLPVIELPRVNASGIFKYKIPRNIEQLKKTSSRIRGYSKIKQNLHGSFADFYDDESKEFVADLYKKDIELFNYNFPE